MTLLTSLSCSKKCSIRKCAEILLVVYGRERKVKVEMAVSKMELCNLAYEGNLEQVRALVRENPDLVRQRDSNQRAALHWACSSGQTEVVRFLLNEGAEVKFEVMTPEPLLLCMHAYLAEAGVQWLFCTFIFLPIPLNVFGWTNCNISNELFL